jgi:hypothetical protein
MRTFRDPSRKAIDVVGIGLALFAIALVPWIGYLATTLPSHASAHHWWAAWAGFDVLLALALGAAGIAAFSRSPRLPVLAAVAATLLVVDAWFDTVTAASPSALAVALLEAVAAELPVAAVCIWLAVTAEAVPAPARRRRHLVLVHDASEESRAA